MSGRGPDQHSALPADYSRGFASISGLTRRVPLERIRPTPFCRCFVVENDVTEANVPNCRLFEFVSVASSLGLSPMSRMFVYF